MLPSNEIKKSDQNDAVKAQEEGELKRELSDQRFFVSPGWGKLAVVLFGDAGRDPLRN
jgi:hypothetical protein